MLWTSAVAATRSRSDEGRKALAAPPNEHSGWGHSASISDIQAMLLKCSRTMK
jgi:hypothetical protein